MYTYTMKLAHINTPHTHHTHVHTHVNTEVHTHTTINTRSAHIRIHAIVHGVCARVMSHISISHLTHMNESCDIYE